MREVDDAKTSTPRHTETVYALTSSPTATGSVLLHASREHWGIENGLHWVRSPGAGLAVASCGADAARMAFSC